MQRHNSHSFAWHLYAEQWKFAGYLARQSSTPCPRISAKLLTSAHIAELRQRRRHHGVAGTLYPKCGRKKRWEDPFQQFIDVTMDREPWHQVAMNPQLWKRLEKDFIQWKLKKHGINDVANYEYDHDAVPDSKYKVHEKPEVVLLADFCTSNESSSDSDNEVTYEQVPDFLLTPCDSSSSSEVSSECESSSDSSESF